MCPGARSRAGGERPSEAVLPSPWSRRRAQSKKKPRHGPEEKRQPLDTPHAPCIRLAGSAACLGSEGLPPLQLLTPPPGEAPLDASSQARRPLLPFSRREPQQPQMLTAATSAGVRPSAPPPSSAFSERRIGTPLSTLGSSGRAQRLSSFPTSHAIAPTPALAFGRNSIFLE
uniref:Uncharacterized protein n=1 Tax=Sphaerodactylus townsendi TaxID=933632 RepID=A0ACB8G3J4_9SAUR